jgi:hypothetical protein
MKKMKITPNNIIASLLGVAIGLLIAFYGLKYLPGGYKILSILFTVAAFITFFFYFMITRYRNKVVNGLINGKSKDEYRVEDLKSVSHSIIEKFFKRVYKLHGVENDLMTKIGPVAINQIIWNRIQGWWVQIGVQVVFLIAGLTTTVLLVNQNDLLQLQNEKLDIQNNLLESDRRGSQVVLMSSVLNDLSSETRRSFFNIIDSTSLKPKLSSGLIGRIIATTHGLLPYKLLKDGQLTDKEFSLERGQLLMAIANTQISRESLKEIFTNSNFQSSYLPGVNLRNTFLAGVDLKFSNLERSSFEGAVLQSISYNPYNIGYEARFLGDDPEMTTFRGANLTFANFDKANLVGVDFGNANLMAASFKNSIIIGTNFKGTSVTKSQLIKSKILIRIRGVDLEILEELKKERPCLFSSDGCEDLNDDVLNMQLVPKNMIDEFEEFNNEN